jgi:Ca2+-binding EF-hand superfamily protein
MFDRRGNGRLRFDEFGLLWKYVQDWQNCFQNFDKDGSGFIDAQELHLAFTAFGYRISPMISNLMVEKFDVKRQGVLAFDDFIQCCLTIYVRMKVNEIVHNTTHSGAK